MSELESKVQSSMLSKAAKTSSKYIDYKMGGIGAVAMSAFVFGVNYNAGADLSGCGTAALKQGLYTFFVGGAVTRSVEYLATRIQKKSLAITSAVVLPCLLTISLTYGVHSMKGTPKPVESTYPTALTIPAFSYWATKKRNEHDREIID